MKHVILPLGLLMSAGFFGSAYADNIAKCEIVLLESVGEDGGSAQVASFRPAGEFISSVYDGEEGHLTESDGHKIRAVMCERSDVIPTLRDFPLLATGIPFSISENFDSSDSRLMTFYYKAGEFKHKYKGPDLMAEDQTKLDEILDVYNLQPHKLPKPDITEEVEDMKRISKEKHEELK